MFAQERKINAAFLDIVDILSNKPKPIRGIEVRIHKLEEEVYAEDMKLLAEVFKYDKNASLNDFASLPSIDDKSDSHISKERDFHYRYVALQEKRNEIANLRNSQKLHEEEGEQGHDIIEHLFKNEIGDAELFVKLFKEKYIFDPTEGKEGAFYLWNGISWQIDLHKERYKDFEQVSLAYTNSLENIKFEESIREDFEKRISQLRTHRRRKCVLETVSAHISFKGKWDNLPNQLPCANGIINLKTGTLTKSHPDQFIKKVCPIHYDYNAKCPKFDQFLKDITLGDEEVERFIARLLGYSILGIPMEEKIFYFFGDGRNGKGTLMHAIQHVLGPLSKTFASEMLMIQRNPPSSSSPNPEMANLEGVRVAVFSEINKKREVDSAKIKNLSGRDIIPCRRLFSNIDLQITPTHTMILQTNYKPKAPADDRALWSRNILVPFNARFVKNPKEKHERPLKESLKDELLKEGAGILKWLVDGCLEYQSKGLQIPQSILDQTECYRKENDSIAQFIDQVCVLANEFSTPCGKMESAIKEYCKEEKLPVPTRNEISAHLKNLFTKTETNSGNFWKGVSIKTQGRSDET
jgi:putative DNA primase/helicase